MDIIKKNIISFSLWGSIPKYTIGAIRNAELAKKIYPNFKCRFYIDNNVPDSIVEELKNLDSEIIYETNYHDWRSMFWRFQAAYDTNIDVVLFRDTDSRLNYREKYAVDEWLSSNKSFHIMRDHPYHGYHILGGMWGYRYNEKYDMKKLFCQFKPQDHYGTDYIFFKEILFPIIGDDKVTHDEFFEKYPFPTTRNNREFVGEVYDERDNRHPEHYLYIPQ